MPLSMIEGLTENSTTEQIREAISKGMEQCMTEGGKDQKECAGMIYSMARERTGKELNYGK